jgi:phosphoglycolate phosphatase
MLKLIAFDWNGTLLSDTQTAVKAENIALKKFGHPPIGINKFRQCFHIPIIEYWKRVGMDEKFFSQHMDEIEKIYNDIYEQQATRCRSRAGVRQTLTWLKTHHYHSIIYSNHIVELINRQLHRLQLKPYITTILARTHKDEGLLHKRSKGEKLASYVKTQNFKPHEVLSIGDTEEEIEIGRQLGYYTVGITGGYNTEKRLKQHKPHFIIHHMGELIKIIKKINTNYA